MLLRDPVHGLIRFEGVDEKVVLALLETEPLQRLRRVRQLGLASFVFPGAEHSRFSHALGAAHVMVRWFDNLRDKRPDLVNDDHRAEALAAALLHDVGHGPFSHLFEELNPGATSHETWSARIVESPETGVFQALSSITNDLPARVSALFRHEHPASFLCQSISGPLDVDRSDYLLRDSHMTGVKDGLYDLDWLLNALTLVEHAGATSICVDGRKGLLPIEGFFLGRRFMFQQVYHHKATRAAEHLMRWIFRRLGELVRDDVAPQALPSALRALALGEDATLNAYLSVDDSTLLYAFKQWTQEKDEELKSLTQAFLSRQLPKTLPVTDLAPDLQQKALSSARHIAERAGLRPDYVALDEAAVKPFDEAQEGAILVQVRHRPLTKLGDASFILGALRDKTESSKRLIYPREIRSEVEEEVRRLMC